jgi:hypothetical protein
MRGAIRQLSFSRLHLPYALLKIGNVDLRSLPSTMPRAIYVKESRDGKSWVLFFRSKSHTLKVGYRCIPFRFLSFPNAGAMH